MVGSAADAGYNAKGLRIYSTIRKTLLIAVLAATLASCANAGAAPSALTPIVTIWEQATVPVTEASQPADAPTVNATPEPQPTPTPHVKQYTVQPDDTLWDIAVQFEVSLDELVLANPNVDPDLLHPGDVINIPVFSIASIAITPEPVPTIAVTPGMAARVAYDAGGLRLRRGPGTDFRVITMLDALTPLTILNLSEDGLWLEVLAADKAGWVMARYVDTNPLPPTPQVEVATAQPGTSDPISTQPLPRAEEYLINFTTRAREIYQAGVARGNLPNVFAVVGDSNSASALFLEPFDRGNYDLGEYSYLEDTIQYYKGSFRFTTVAAVVGFDTLKLMDPARADPSRCQPGESPLACEYRRKQPSVALILIGTNDVYNWQRFEANFRRIVEYTLAQGILPVLMTKGDDLESTKYTAAPGYINKVIADMSHEYGVPLLDLHAAVSKLPNNGFIADGFHYNIPPDRSTARFTGEHLNYGYTIRNLTALQALDAVRRLVIQQ